MSPVRSARLEIRTTPERRAAVEARAAELGQSLTTFVERALDEALGSTKSAAVAYARQRQPRSRNEITDEKMREAKQVREAPRPEGRQW